MLAPDRHLALVFPRPTEVACAAGDYGSEITQDQQLRDLALGQPASIAFHDRGHISRIPLNRDLSRPSECWQSRLTLEIRRSVRSHLLVGQFPDHASRQ